MSLHEKYICSECQQKVSSIAKRFNNGKQLCEGCAKTIKDFSHRMYISYENYQAIKQYQKETYERLRPLFRETHRYQNIHVDAKNHIFYIGDAINESTLFLLFKNVKACKFDCNLKEKAKIWFGKVSCIVTISIEMNHHNIAYKYSLHDSANAKFDNSEFVFGNLLLGGYYIDNYSCDWPKALKKFTSFFYNECKRYEYLHQKRMLQEKLLEQKAMLDSYNSSLVERGEAELTESEYMEIIEYLQNQ